MKPRRSNLSVPGHLKKMHGKANESLADVIMLDLEDSVPVEEKGNARDQVIESLLNLDWKQKTVTVRINALDTPFAYRDLLEIAENAGHIIDAIVIPKVNHPGDIYFADRMLNGIEMAKNPPFTVGLEASIETAEGCCGPPTSCGPATVSKPWFSASPIIQHPSAPAWFPFPDTVRRRRNSIPDIAGILPSAIWSCMPRHTAALPLMLRMAILRMPTD
jgi:hypothetical protein